MFKTVLLGQTSKRKQYSLHVQEIKKVQESNLATLLINTVMQAWQNKFVLFNRTIFILKMVIATLNFFGE
jgi:hypothetical protein